MSKVINWIWLSVLLICLFCFGTVFADMQQLQSNVIRVHVIANSDDPEDQRIKLSVRDAVIDYLKDDMEFMTDAQDAKAYIYEELPQLESIVNSTLAESGSNDYAHVSLTKEAFGMREYDTFRLPSGIYDSLKIEIGNAEGKNWWCVVFPSLCLPTTTEEFMDTAVASGFDQGLVSTLSGNERYEVRFFFLDCLGKLENLFSLT